MSSSLSTENLKLAANTIRFLAVDGVEKSQSGHPGMPMGMAELASVLWLKHLKHNPKDSSWLGRDRFVLSNGHGSMLIYSMLHLSGYKVSLDDLKQFRQWDSNTPGHPESFMTDGVETTTGPLGQGIGNAVGMAIASKLMSARYSSGKFDPFNQKIWCFCGDGCLMEGVSSEASSLAGHLGLNNLVIVYDDNNISIAGRTDLAFTEDVEKRYQAYGFKTIRVDGHDVEAIDKAYTDASMSSEQPVLILAKTIIGKGSPNKSDSYGVHGSPLGKEELKLTKEAMGWPLEPTFYVPDEVRAVFSHTTDALLEKCATWKESFDAWGTANPEKLARLNHQTNIDIPSDLEDKLVAVIKDITAPTATRKLSESVLQAASKNVDSLIGGSADLEPSTLTLIKGSTDIEKGQFEGLNLRFGVREHGMGAIMNGLSYYGGYIPYGSTFMCFLDYMKPTLRLAALSHLRGLFIYTHDSIFLGEDGPTHQPIEHLQMMRLIPNVHVYRPADALETAVSYASALQKKDGPSVLVFTRQNLPQIERSATFDRSEIRRGAYNIYETSSKPDLVFIATGSEVALALDTAKMIEGASVRVVSMPCYENYKVQDSAYKESLIPSSAKKITIEAGATLGWSSMVGGGPKDCLNIGIDHFGASAPAEVLAEKFGLKPELVRAKVKEVFGV